MMQERESQIMPPPKEAADTVSVLLFSVLRENLGASELQVDVARGSTVADVLDAVCTRHPVVKQYRSVLRVGLNAAYANESAPVADGDEVALITPVSGG